MKNLETIALADVFPSWKNLKIAFDVKSANSLALKRYFVIDVPALACRVSGGAISVDGLYSLRVSPFWRSVYSGRPPLGTVGDAFRVVLSAKCCRFIMEARGRVRGITQSKPAPSDRVPVALLALTTAFQITSKSRESTSSLTQNAATHNTQGR